MTEPSPAPAVTGPVPERDRIPAIDVVRGLAVLGILTMNIVEFGLPLGAYENPAYAGGSTGGDLWMWLTQVTLFDGRMRALFSMLFGGGLWLIGERMVRNGNGGRAADLLLRRCLWLVPLGIAHRFLLQWTGDILYQYGLLGLVVIAFRNLRPRWQIMLGLLALGAFVPKGLMTFDTLTTQRAQAAEARELKSGNQEVPKELADALARWERREKSVPPKPEDVQKEIDTIRGSWTTIWNSRVGYHHSFQTNYLYSYFVWDVTGMLLIGMGLMQLGFFAGRCRSAVYWTAIVAGLASSALAYWWGRAVADGGFAATAVELRLWKDLGYPFVRGVGALGWAAVLILLVRAGWLRRCCDLLGLVGRMAFTNYVLQTVCCSLYFHGYGLGRFGEHSRSGLVLVWAAVSAIQVVVSVLWLRMFASGPLEWLWRSLVHWRVQPMRRARTGH